MIVLGFSNFRTTLDEDDALIIWEDRKRREEKGNDLIFEHNDRCISEIAIFPEINQKCQKNTNYD